MLDAFSTLLQRAFDTPPKDDGDSEGTYAHRYLGRHGMFQGRRYRRGVKRCLRCGAYRDTPDSQPDPLRQLSPRQRIVAAIWTPSPVWAWITTKQGAA